jgi:hypothetical protein
MINKIGIRKGLSSQNQPENKKRIKKRNELKGYTQLFEIGSENFKISPCSTSLLP